MRLGLVALAVALAGWLLPASVHIVSWENGGAQRVAQLAPWWELAVWLTATGGTALGIRTWCPAAVSSRIASILSPLCILLIWVVPYLPWIPDTLPLLLLFAGPLRGIVAVMAGVGCAIALLEPWLGSWSRRALPGAGAVFAASLVVLTATGYYVKVVQGLGGDEPHYLVIAHSLMADGDLRIENNHDARDYDAFFTGSLRPHTLRRGQDSVMYSVHAPGLPALLLPAYTLFGRWGATLAIVFLASLTARNMFVAAERVTSRGIAWVTWLATALTVPFVPHAWSIFPELPAAVILSGFAIWLVTDAPARPAVWWWRGLAIGVLPWLHMKYSVVLVGATLCLLIKLWPRVSHVIAFLAPMAASGVLWFASFVVMYGTPNPTVVYGYGQAADMNLATMPRGLLGVLFDQEFGVLLYSPVYVLAAAGLWATFRRRVWRWPTVGLTMTALGLAASFAAYPMWWGGYSAPARFAVPGVPLMAPIVALGFAACRSAATRGIAGLLVASSLTVCGALLINPADRLLYNDRDGSSQLVEAWQGGVDLTTVLPTFIPLEWWDERGTIFILLAAGFAGWALAVPVGRRHNTVQRAFWSGTACLIGFAFVVSGLANTTLSVHEKGSSVRLGQQAGLAAYDGVHTDRHLYRPAQGLGEEQWLDYLTMDQKAFDLTWRDLGRTRNERGRVAGPFALAAGEYRIRVWLDEELAPAAEHEVWVAYRRGPGLLSRRPVVSDMVEMALDLPVTLDSVWIGASSARVSESITRVEIRPRHTVPRHRRLSLTNIRQAEAVNNHPGRYVMHVDDNAFVEARGFWVRGGTRTALHVAPKGASALIVRVRTGAAAGPVTIHVDDQEHVLALRAREQTRLRIPLAGDELLVPLSVTASGGFRPSDGLSNSQDHRWLGAWLAVSFEEPL